MGMKLICEDAPSAQVVQNAITVLNSYQQRFRMTMGGPMQVMPNGMGYNNMGGMAMGMNMGAALGQHGQVSMSSVYGGYGGYDANAQQQMRDNGYDPIGNAVSPGGDYAFDEPE